MSVVLYIFMLATQLWVFVLGYTEQYRGFDSCGVGGWHCNNTGSEYEVTYLCGPLNRNIRIWVWTARIPSMTTILSVSGCHHVEIHLDCTMGYRAYMLRQFRATNVQHLEFLRPLRPHVFLHDNDEVAHTPPEMILTNVAELTLFPGIFDRAAGRCRTKQQVLERLTFSNVTLDQLEKDTLRNLTIDLFHWHLVNVKRLRSESVSIDAGDITITNSSLSIIPPRAFILQGDMVSIQGNDITSIGTEGFNIKAENFEFSKNIVRDSQSYSLQVLARKVRIAENTWENVEANSFANIQPGSKGSVGNYRQAKKFSYEFLRNRVDHLKKNGLHPNYKAYNEACSIITIKENEFPCNCQNFFEGPLNKSTHLWWNHIFKEGLNTANVCKDTKCPVVQALNYYLANPCDPASTSSFYVCGNQTFEVTEEVTEAAITWPTSEETQPTTTEKANTHIEPDSSRFSFPKDTKTEPSSVSGAVTGSIIGVILGVTAIAGFAFWIHRRVKKTNKEMPTVYTPELDDDEENLIAQRPGRAISIQSLS